MRTLLGFSKVYRRTIFLIFESLPESLGRLGSMELDFFFFSQRIKSSRNRRYDYKRSSPAISVAFRPFSSPLDDVRPPGPKGFPVFRPDLYYSTYTDNFFSSVRPNRARIPSGQSKCVFGLEKYLCIKKKTRRNKTPKTYLGRCLCESVRFYFCPPNPFSIPPVLFGLLFFPVFFFSYCMIYACRLCPFWYRISIMDPTGFIILHVCL